MIGVAGEKDGETLADFSSRGRPGDDATYIPPQYQPYYTTAGGTGMATPYVAGTVALMEEADETVAPDEAKSILTPRTRCRTTGATR